MFSRRGAVITVFTFIFLCRTCLFWEEDVFREREFESFVYDFGSLD